MYFIQPGRACALRALGLLLADGYLRVGLGKTFWRAGRVFFRKTAVPQKRKVGKSIRRCKMDRLSEIRVLRQKKHSLLAGRHVLATTRQSCANKKVPFSQINIGLLADFFYIKN